MKTVKILVVIGMLLIPAMSFSQAMYRKPVKIERHKEFMSTMIHVVKAHNSECNFFAKQIEAMRYNPSDYTEEYVSVPDSLIEAIKYNPDEYVNKDIEKEYEEFIKNN